MKTLYTVATNTYTYAFLFSTRRVDSTNSDSIHIRDSKARQLQKDIFSGH